MNKLLHLASVLVALKFTSGQKLGRQEMEKLYGPSINNGNCGSRDLFDCGNGRCVSLLSIRDCIDDCGNHADEECGIGQLICDTLSVPCGRCVANYTAHTACLDRKWQNLCKEPEDLVFKCDKTENCVLKAWLNDGDDDCGDMSDEDPCRNGEVQCGIGGVRPNSGGRPVKVSEAESFNRIPGNCQQMPDSDGRITQQFDCKDKDNTCISLGLWQNCQWDCPDGSDEACFGQQIQCPDNVCGCVDPNNATESCLRARECKQNEFRCLMEKECISELLVHDGRADCTDRSDEDTCFTANCASGQQCNYVYGQNKFECDCPDGWITHSAGSSQFGICRPTETDPKDCADIQAEHPAFTSDVLNIYRPGCLSARSQSCVMPVLCDLDTHGGGWTVIMKRTGDRVNFTQNWEAYTKGFGDVERGNFWIGLEYIHELTTVRPVPNQRALIGIVENRYELLISMTTTDLENMQAHYSYFRVESEKDNYKLRLGSLEKRYCEKLAQCTTVDAMATSNGKPFGTPDRDTDQLKDVNCGRWWQSGWWHHERCERTGNLNVPYLTGFNGNEHLLGIKWGDKRLQKVIMMIRPINFKPVRAKGPMKPDQDSAKFEGLSAGCCNNLSVSLFLICNFYSYFILIVHYRR